jgi:hypothetical protein
MSVSLKDKVEFMSKHESLGGDPNVTFLNIIHENSTGGGSIEDPRYADSTGGGSLEDPKITGSMNGGDVNNLSDEILTPRRKINDDNDISLTSNRSVSLTDEMHDKKIDTQNSFPFFCHLQRKDTTKFFLNKILIIKSDYGLIFKFEINNNKLKYISINKDNIDYYYNLDYNSSMFVKNIDKTDDVKNDFIKLVNDKFMKLLNIEFEFIFDNYGMIYSTYDKLKNIII